MAVTVWGQVLPSKTCTLDLDTCDSDFVGTGAAIKAMYTGRLTLIAVTVWEQVLTYKTCTLDIRH